jgi:hypothetical protein
MEHLLNTCHYSQQIWDWGAQAMRRSQRDRSSIRETLVNWDVVSFQNPILQRIWQLLPGFILWAIWKERNKRIFNSTPSPPLHHVGKGDKVYSGNRSQFLLAPRRHAVQARGEKHSRRMELASKYANSGENQK